MPSHYASQRPTHAENCHIYLIQAIYITSILALVSFFVVISYPKSYQYARIRQQICARRRLLLFFSSFFFFKKPSHPSLTSHSAQMFQHGLVGVQKPIHTILYARLLLPVQAARRDTPGNALLPACICEFVHG